MEIGRIYEKHHAEKGRFGFSVLEGVRAEWFLAHMPKGGSLLDVGCRDATLTRHFAEACPNITGIDIDRHALAAAKEHIPNGTFLELDLTGDWHELRGGTFDVILCSEVLEHVYFPGQVIKRISEHLKPGGIFIGSIPNAFFLKHRLRYLFGQRKGTPLEDPTHITQFHVSLLRDMLLQVGTEVCIEGYTRPPLGWLARKCPRLFAFDVLFSVKKTK